MSTEKDSVQAQHALIDPLIEPDPSDETGLNSHFRSTFAPAPGQQQNQLPTPPGSAGLKQSPSASIREQHTGSTVETNPFRRSRASSASQRKPVPSQGSSNPSRRKKNFQGTDTIDRLDKSTFGYHHEGPYDAASLARNKSWKHSPVAAVQDSNEEALRATPRENIIDAVTKHRPLEGTANIPPGVPDRFGRVLDYEEGTDLHREPGPNAYRRWPGMDYHPDDLKGKGEPSFTIDNALKNHKKYGEDGREMQNRRRNQSLGTYDAPESVPLQSGFEAEGGIQRSRSTNGGGGGVGSALKKRFGSLRRRREQAA